MTRPVAMRPADPEPVSVRLAFTGPRARAVSVAGTFNGWNPGALHSTGDGEWRCELALLPGVYEYRLIVDGHWMPDPLARESVPNPYGDSNSVLRVACTSASAHLHEATHSPFISQCK